MRDFTTMFLDYLDSLKLFFITTILDLELILRKGLGKSIKKFKIINFEKKISKLTDKNYNITLKLANDYYNNIDQKFLMNNEKQKEVIKHFHNKYHDNTNVFYLHLPSYKKAIGSYSAFNNLGIALTHLGFQCFFFSNYRELKKLHFDDSKNNIIIVLDNEQYLKYSGSTIKQNLKKSVKVGCFLNFFDIEEKENLYLNSFKNSHIDFFFTFSSDEYNDSKFQPFQDVGAMPVGIEFGANPFIHYPIKNEKYLDYIFLGSTNRRKIDRYIDYFSEIFEKYNGFIYGPGWLKFSMRKKPFYLDSILYSFSKVGLNLSVPEQLIFPRELNERTYQLAACGVPQIIDNPMLLEKRFPKNSMFSVQNKVEYYNVFRAIVNNEIIENDLNKMIDVAYHITLNNHTIFHRAEKFIKYLIEKRFLERPTLY